jgi:CBS domain-containing protein/anti-sigma regulatory factor (Ser/Thr protein kinase)
MSSTQELYGRKGTLVTDATAHDITRVEELAYDIRIEEVMTTEVHYLAPDAPISDLLELMRTTRISGAPVVEDGNLIGIVSLEDLIRALTEHDTSSPVRKYMNPRVITVNGSDPVIEAMECFTKNKVGRFPVVDREGKMIGMITKGDVTRGLLISLQHDYQAEEVRRYRASHLFEDINSDRTSLILRYKINAGDFIHGGKASSDIKRALLRLGASPQIARRCGIAIYEAEMNLIIHTTDGGLIRVEIEPHRITMQTIDDGPGIPDVDLAMQAGYTTASQDVREMGFGAGMGLVNIRRCVDSMSLKSRPEKGTRLDVKINLQDTESFRELSQTPKKEPNDGSATDRG